MRISLIIRSVIRRLAPSRELRCTACSRERAPGLDFISVRGAYVCTDCVARASSELTPRRPPADAIRCQTCGNFKAQSELTTLGSLRVCADCLGSMQFIADSAAARHITTRGT
jgi:DNA-directed RNA polymerase subunit RPC12/RpoP